MRVEQAIYTSLSRAGRAGYHVVSRSPGVSDEEAQSLASWSPSHGALLLDASNRASINLHPLAGGRCALSRSCEGRPEYSGRGGRQVYTHALIFDPAQLRHSGVGPFAIYRSALSLGHLVYRPHPEPNLDPVELGRCHRSADPDRALARLHGLGLGDLIDERRRLGAGEAVRLRYAGNRASLVESLLDLLAARSEASVSFSTSLQASPTRPYRLCVLG